MTWGKAGTNTLSGAQTNNVVTGMTASKTNQFLTHAISGVGANQVEMQFGNGSIDGATNYAFRKSDNGGADGVSASTSVFKLHNASSQQDKFAVGYIVNIASEEKIGIGHIVEANTAGAGNAPLRAESVGKWANTSVQFDQIEHQSENLQSDSNLTVLGSDITPAAAIPFAENAQVGSRAEITDTRKIYNLHDAGTNVLYEDATGQSNTSGHGTVVFIGDNATYATLFSRIAATNTTHPHPAVNVDTPNKAFSSSDPWTIELTFKESYTIPSGSTITYDSYNNGQGARLKYLDFQVYTGSTWENITGTITNPNHSDGDVETTSGRWVKYMTSTTTTEKTGTKFRIRMWDSWDNYVTNGRHYIGGIELKIPIGNVSWQEIGA